jgi:hypothetical protein
MCWLASAASDSRTGGLTKPKLVKSKRVAEEVNEAIREILYLRWIEGED